MSFGDDTLDPSNFWDGKERRSGGPMATTVDRVIRRCANHGSQIQEWSFTEFDAAVRRSAEKAALSIAGMIDCRHDSPYVADFVTAIERHVRQELGL